MQAKIVVGLGWGDEGKGITTDYLASQYPDSIIVRYNGGHQAAHNVVIGEKSHIHSSYGAGTLRGRPSYLTEHCCFYPPNMEREYDVLIEKGIKPKLYIHPFAKVTTPYDVAYNRVMERRNGHGSIGIGIGTTFSRNEGPYKLHALDILYADLFNQKMNAISKYYNPKVVDFSVEEMSYYMDVVTTEFKYFRSALSTLKFEIRSYNFLRLYDTLIFEGAQGIMLDMDFGVFPNVTYSHTTSKNAMEICDKLSITDVEVFYVTRCYQTRHGNGWMSNTEPIKLINNEKETNVTNEWQGNFRTGELDYDLLQYAIICDNTYTGNAVKRLVVTCLDHRPSFKLRKENIPLGIRSVLTSSSPDSQNFKHEVFF